MVRSVDFELWAEILYGAHLRNLNEQKVWFGTTYPDFFKLDPSVKANWIQMAKEVLYEVDHHYV